MNPTNAEIRQFILDTFTEEDFELFCVDYFGEAKGAIPARESLQIKAQLLIEYSQHRGLLDNLLAALQKERPERYAQQSMQVSIAPVVVSHTIVRNPRQVFISHAHEDAEFAQRLGRDLRQRGWSVWIAPDSIRPGEKWVSAINRGLQESSHFLAVLTPQAFQSGWVTSETDAAIELEHEGALRLIPLEVQRCSVSPLLRSYQRVPFQGRYEDGLTALLNVLNPNLLVLESPFHLELVRVPAGEFMMGSDPAKDKLAQEDEQPQHRVYVSEFYISRYPITIAQYGVYIKATGREKEFSPPPDKDDHPVFGVSWLESDDFCTWLSQSTGKSFRLPTEAEWEKAARGTNGRIYPWGNKWDKKRLNSYEGGASDTTPVCKYSSAGDSPYGAADMAGNVWEWMADWYSEDEYKEHTRTSLLIKDPTGPASGTARVLRGGSWVSGRNFARAAYRYRLDPLTRDYYFGFRVVLGAAPVP